MSAIQHNTITITLTYADCQAMCYALGPICDDELIKCGIPADSGDRLFDKVTDFIGDDEWKRIVDARDNSKFSK